MRTTALQPVAVALSAGAGLGLEVVGGVSGVAEPIVLPALMALLVGVFAPLRPSRIASAIRRRRVIFTSLAMNFAWTPLLAAALGVVLLGDEPALRIGLVLLLVTPCTDWYLVFTGLARGDVELGVALLPVNLVLQLVLLPVYVLTLTGAAAPVSAGRLVGAVILVLAVPAAAAATLRLAAARWREPGWLESRVFPRLDTVNLVLLCVAVAAVYAAHGGALADRPVAAGLVLPALGIFFVANFALAAALSRLLGLHHPERVTLTMTTLARNSPLALAVAVAAFPDQPLIAVVLVVGPLVELPVLATVAGVLGRRRPVSDQVS